jgi:alkylation response protein AidB-like acyl-CoA dehydrogenase
LPRASVEIADNWDTLGLAGTGSHNLVIADVEVPLHRVTSVFDRAPWSQAALYRVPLFGLLAVGIAGCALGIARSALASAAGRLTAEAGSATWSDVALLRGRLDAARAYLHATADVAYAEAATGTVTPSVRGALRLASCHAVAACTDVARGAFHIGGGTSVRAGSPIGNALRDLETVRTHKMVTDRVLPAAIRAMQGIGATPPDL